MSFNRQDRFSQSKVEPSPRGATPPTIQLSFGPHQRSLPICGIAGIVDFRSAPFPGQIEEITQTLSHRGPDHQGTWLEGPAALGHRRLSILDLSPRGNQPMLDDSERYVIAFNGEIYNFPELKADLEAKGDTFRTTTDTEVVLAMFRRYGLDALVRLNGMFAIAIWDRTERRLTLARDRFGQKPLFLYRSGERLVFGSEIKAIIALPMAREIDFDGLSEFAFFGNGLGTTTLFRDIHKLPAGGWLTFDRSGIKSGPFWRIDDVRAVDDDLETATGHIRTLLDAAVKRHLVSDVPVGVFLSGGIDSSAVTLLSSNHTKLSSYSVGFDHSNGELPVAAQVAKKAGTDHHEVRVQGAEMTDVVRDLVKHHDQPFGDAADVPLYLLAKQLQGKLKVVLGGDGGDEIFAGYRRYNVLAHTGLFGLTRALLPLFDRWPIERQRQRVRRFAHAASEPDAAQRMALLLTEESQTPSPFRLFSPGVRRNLTESSAFARYRAVDELVRHLDPVQRMLHTDCSILLPDIFCEKIDRATMASSLEVRLPFLDNELTQYALGLPWQYKVHRLEKKWLLRKALRGTVPDSVLDAPKMGFGVPYGEWLRGPLRGLLEDTVLTGKAASQGLLDKSTCAAMIAGHVAGNRPQGFLLYKLLNFALWVEAYL